MNPQRAMSYSDRGSAYYRLGDIQQAFKDYNKAIEINPKYSEAYYFRGKAYYKLGDTQHAIRDYKIAARLGNKHTQDLLSSRNIEW